MRSQTLLLASTLAAGTACSTIPMEVSHPAPVEIILRTREGAACRLDRECGRTPEAIGREGPMVFVDGDSVVMTDTRSGQRVAVHPGPGVQLEVYRGQHRSVEAVARGAGKGFLVGIVAGAAEGLISGGLSKLVGLGGDVGDAVKGGIVAGGSAGALAGGLRGLNEGDAAWEAVTLLQLRQQFCHCADPARPR